MSDSSRKAHNPRVRRSALSLAITLACGSSAVYAETTISGELTLGSFPSDLTVLPGFSPGETLQISADGNVVTGTAMSPSSGASLPFTYTSTGGVKLLSLDPAYPFAKATGIDGTGTLIVGYETDAAGLVSQGVVWNLVSGTHTAVVTSGASSVGFSTISTDGKVIGGAGQFVGGVADSEGIVQALGSSTAIRVDPTSIYAGGSSILKLNSDGSVGIGFGSVSAVVGSGAISGFRWSQAGGLTDLGSLNGGMITLPTALSANGDVVVGAALDGASPLTTRSFRWTAATGLVSLGALHDDLNTSSGAFGVDASGDVIVGFSMTTAGIPSQDGYRWTAATGMQTIPEWLRSKGIAVSSTALPISTAQSVSADGNTVTGTLSDGNVYIARVVETTTTPTAPTEPAAPLPPETPPSTGTGSGIITLANYMNSLSAASQAPSQALQGTEMILTGAHGSPMRGLIAGNQQYVWSTGDWGRADVSNDSHANQGAIEIGYARGIGETSMAKVAVGRSYSDQDSIYDGNIRARGTYILPEFISAIPGTPLYGTLSGYYNFGDADVRRGYDNAGFPVHSTGSASQHTWAAQGRLDWLNAVQGDRFALTPYASLLYMQNHMGSYSESGGGFPVNWDARTDRSTQARLGLDGVFDLSGNVKLLGRVEGVHRFESKGSDASGEILGLSSFSLDGTKYKQNWLRFGVGMEVGVGKGTVSLAGNATTEAETTRYWGSLSYRLPF